MAKNTPLCLFILCAVLLTACQSGKNNFTASLKAFPLARGTSWTYNNTGYAQSANDPNSMIKGTAQIVESVVDIQSQSSFFIAHIQGSKTMLKADPGWQENGTFALGNYEYWYIVNKSGQVFLSTDRPDPQNILTDQLLLEYQFPMAKGSTWCPNKQQKTDLTPRVETPVPCATAGMREVEGEESYTTQAGKFDHCYRMVDVYNSGGVTQWLCDGVGMVAQTYAHAGSQFGFTQELIKFSPGKPE